MIWGLCYAIRRETLTKLGGFHPDAYLWELYVIGERRDSTV